MAVVVARQWRVVHTVSVSCPTDRGTPDVAAKLGGYRPRGAASVAGWFLATGPVLVIRVVLHVSCSQSLGFVDERPLVELRKTLPFGAEPLRDFRVVHLGVVDGDAPPLAA